MYIKGKDTRPFEHLVVSLLLISSLTSSSAPELQYSELPTLLPADDRFNQTTELLSEEVEKNMSRTLDDILADYDKNMRPVVGTDRTKPTEILVDLNIRSMGPISEKDRSYSMDCYFRQTWRDPRLRYVGKMKEIAVHIKLLEKLWKPDTYFLNGKDSYLHTITTPNKLLRIRPDGTILYSMRLTIKADCPMQLKAYPMDTQYCPLTILSFAHGDNYLNFVWKYGNNQSIVMSDDVKLSQFDIINYPHSNSTHIIRDVRYSSLKVVFGLQRHMGYFLLQVYVPSMLLVIMSWVTFWLNREATSDRVGLGITVILTMTTMTSENSRDLPQVPYATALDLYVQMCFMFVIFSMVQFVGVHYFTKTGGGDYPDIDSEDELEELTEEQLKQMKEDKKAEKERKKRLQQSAIAKGIRMMSIGAFEPEKESFGRKFLSCLQGNHTYRNMIRKKARIAGGGANSVSQLDKISRILFPTTFTVLNIIYWSVYYFGGRP